MHPTEPALDLRGPAPRVAIAAVRNPFSRSAGDDPGDRAPRSMNRAYSMPAYPHLSRIIAEARRCAPLVTAVVMPAEPTALAGALEAAQSGLVAPILVGPRSSIARAARADHPHQSRGLGAGPHCLLRTRSSLYPPRCRGKERQ